MRVSARDAEGDRVRSLLEEQCPVSRSRKARRSLRTGVACPDARSCLEDIRTDVEACAALNSCRSIGSQRQVLNNSVGSKLSLHQSSEAGQGVARRDELFLLAMPRATLPLGLRV